MHVGLCIVSKWSEALSSIRCPPLTTQASRSSSHDTTNSSSQNAQVVSSSSRMAQVTRGRGSACCGVCHAFCGNQSLDSLLLFDASLRCLKWSSMWLLKCSDQRRRPQITHCCLRQSYRRPTSVVSASRRRGRLCAQGLDHMTSRKTDGCCRACL